MICYVFGLGHSMNNCENDISLFHCFSVPGSKLGLSIVTDTSFASLKSSVCEETLRGVADMGFTHMTEIQAKCIPHLLEGRLVHASTPLCSFVAPTVSTLFLFSVIFAEI